MRKRITFDNASSSILFTIIGWPSCMKRKASRRMRQNSISALSIFGKTLTPASLSYFLFPRASEAKTPAKQSPEKMRKPVLTLCKNAS